ncbi:MAG: GspMb/PilO family protein [Syntrophobacteraceae bacterium]
MRNDLSWEQLKKKKGSAAFALIAILSLLVGHVFWLGPILAEKEEVTNRVKQQTEIAAKYEEKLKQAQAIRDNLAKQESKLKELQKSLFKGHDPYQLAASLGDMLSAKDGQKLDMKTYQVLASKEHGLYQEVTLRFNFMTSIEGLNYFLDKVRNFQTSIVVQEMNIQKVQRKGGPDLVVNVILAALMEKGEKS